jgi:hypothetical protein
MHAVVTWLREWFNDWEANSALTQERTDALLGAERRELIELPNAASSAAMIELIRDAGDDMFAMLVDRKRWADNAGHYGNENEPLDVRRLANLIPLLLERSSGVTNACLYAHRNKHLDAENRRLLGFSALLTDDEHLLVVFSTPSVGDPTKLRGPFVKMLFGYAEFAVYRDAATGTFRVPKLAEIREQIGKTKCRQFEELPSRLTHVNIADQPSSSSASSSSVVSTNAQHFTAADGGGGAKPFSAREMREPVVKKVTASSMTDEDVVRLLNSNEVVSN